MDDRNIIGGSRHNTFNHSLFGNFSGTLFWVVLRCMMQTN